MNENKNKNELAYKIGQAMVLVAGLCVLSIVIALTVKFIMWIL